MSSIREQEKLTSLEFIQVVTEGKCLSKLTVNELGIVMDKYVDYCNSNHYKTLKEAFIAGYKKRALMSGLKYDDVSELNAITNFKCWKSFDSENKYFSLPFYCNNSVIGLKNQCKDQCEKCSNWVNTSF